MWPFPHFPCHCSFHKQVLNTWFNGALRQMPKVSMEAAPEQELGGLEKQHSTDLLPLLQALLSSFHKVLGQQLIFYLPSVKEGDLEVVLSG